MIWSASWNGGSFRPTGSPPAGGAGTGRRDRKQHKKCCLLGLAVGSCTSARIRGAFALESIRHLTDMAPRWYELKSAPEDCVIGNHRSRTSTVFPVILLLPCLPGTLNFLSRALPVTHVEKSLPCQRLSQRGRSWPVRKIDDQNSTPTFRGPVSVLIRLDKTLQTGGCTASQSHTSCQGKFASWLMRLTTFKADVSASSY